MYLLNLKDLLTFMVEQICHENNGLYGLAKASEPAAQDNLDFQLLSESATR